MIVEARKTLLHTRVLQGEQSVFSSFFGCGYFLETVERQVTWPAVNRTQWLQYNINKVSLQS